MQSYIRWGTFASALALNFGAGLAGAESAVATAALARTEVALAYDGAYRRIGYPGGDVPATIGVCTDLVIRAYRTLGVDLQKQVHEDMRANFDVYPKLWGLSRPDTNIDHRRVPNLETFFARAADTLRLSRVGADYQPGDIVTWRLTGNLPHIGIVANERVAGTDRHYIVHNIGLGPRREDVLFAYRLHGHYRYAPGEIH